MVAALDQMPQQQQEGVLLLQEEGLEWQGYCTSLLLLLLLAVLLQVMQKPH
jgi:hypothetical protein